MRLGMFMMPVHPPGRSLSDTLAEDTAKSILADQLGYDELWMGEHFSATTEPFPSPLMFLAGLVPQTKNLTFGTAVINLPQPPSGDRRRRGRAVRPHERRPLPVRRRLRRARLRLRAVQDRPGDAPARLHGIDRHDPAHLGAGPALRHPGRVLERADQEGDPARARRRLHAEAAAEAASADPHLDRQPRLARRPSSPARKAGASSRARSRRSMRSPTTGRPTAKRGAQAGKRARSEDWRVSRLVIVAPTDAEAEERVYGERASNRYYCSYMRNRARRGQPPRP